MSTIEKAVDRLTQVSPGETILGPPQAEDSSRRVVPLMRNSIETAINLGGRGIFTEAAVKEDAHLDAAIEEILEQPLAEVVTEEGEPQARADFARLQASGMVSPHVPRSQIAEEFRVIKRPLLKNAYGETTMPIEHANLIMVTSAFPGEGKTFTALNLAISIAMEFDKTVLLIDADVARCSASGFFGVENAPGLVDYLTGEVNELSQLLLRTDIPKLTMLPAGRRHGHATELLASDNMKSLAEQMSRRYKDRVIIFDSPPLLATTEAAVLASLVGQVVVVVGAEHTTREALKEALSHIDAHKSTSLVLNKSRQPAGSEYYSAYYGYGR